MLCTFVLASHGIVRAQWQVGPHIIVSIPQADFENASAVGGGFGVKANRELSELFTLRGDFSYISYGKEFKPLLDNQGRPIGDVFGPYIAELRNEGYRLIGGPQLNLQALGLRLYSALEGGLYYYRTNVNIPTAFQLVSRSDNNNFAWGWNINGGFQFDIGLGPWLDFSLEYHTVYNVPQVIEDEITEATTKVDIDLTEFAVKFGVNFTLD
jgi:hypothetical protein